MTKTNIVEKLNYVLQNIPVSFLTKFTETFGITYKIWYNVISYCFYGIIDNR